MRNAHGSQRPQDLVDLAVRAFAFAAAQQLLVLSPWMLGALVTSINLLSVMPPEERATLRFYDALDPRGTSIGGALPCVSSRNPSILSGRPRR
jgi:hypothetical protein